MSKRKYKVFIDLVLIFLCLFPLIATLVVMGTSETIMTGEQICETVTNFTISADLQNKIADCCNSFGVAFNGAFYGATMTIVSNAVLIYVLYVFVSVLVYIPKFAIKMLNLTIGDKSQ